jgi:hypothetical protein
MSRFQEVASIADHLGIIASRIELSAVAERIEKISTKKQGNCLDPGGSGVRDWVRRQLAPEFKPNRKNDDRFVKIGVFHFWSWDAERYGPPPTGGCGTNVDTMRSPTYRLIDAKPIDRTAYRVAAQRKAK